MTIILTTVDEDGEDVPHTFPARHEVCSRCEGHGTHLTPSIGEHAYTREEFNEAFDDDEDRAEYFRHGGKYDVTCEACDGLRVVPVVDESRLSDEQKVVLAACYERAAEHARWDAEDRATRRAENGGY